MACAGGRPGGAGGRGAVRRGALRACQCGGVAEEERQEKKAAVVKRRTGS